MQALLVQRMRKRPHDMLLPDERLEALWAILTGEDLIRHGYAGCWSQAGILPDLMQVITELCHINMWKGISTMQWPTHAVTNQVPELQDYNLFTTDIALREGVRRAQA